MAVKKYITQATFDDAVRENIETFDMEPEEAMKSAVEEFKLQGVDLSTIIVRSSPQDELSTSVNNCLAQLQEDLNNAAAAKKLHADVKQLYDVVQRYEAEGQVSQVVAVAGKEGGVMLLGRCCEAASVDAAFAVTTLQCVNSLMGWRDNKLDFVKYNGMGKLMALWNAFPDDDEVKAAICGCVCSSATACEEAMAQGVDEALAALIVQALGDSGCPAEFIVPACDAIAALTTADDLQAPASRAFQNSRMLAQEGAAKNIAGVLQRYSAVPIESSSTSSSVLCAACAALRRVCANDDICKEVAEAGGVAAALKLLNTGVSNPVVVRASAALLRQLASSDHVKKEILASDGLQAIDHLQCSFPGNHPVVEQAMGALAVITLRNVEATEKVVSCGVLHHIMTAMSTAHAARGQGDDKCVPAILRQGCMALRNMACRHEVPGVKEAINKEGAEQLLRSFKGLYGSSVWEVASAALRDLGLDDYK